MERSDREIYTIKVENSRGPILLLSGQDDQQWLSERMATLIEGRLKDKNYPYEVRNVIYPDAGHWLLSFKDSYPIIASSFFRNRGMNINGKYYQFENGGTAWGTMVARRNTRKETLQFLKQFK
ncbi:acyl-CoA thioester hydrolase/BAAT C-terminal domain-containing protein [Cytophagaceae bacterium NT2B1]|nr:acyl-CoA thioester hydrolase/BAAT C-terminal domain-containing protein [Xanthocytophaga flavus]